MLLVTNASAGSGKTFNLAFRYLALVLENPNRFKRVLALTFTNKATEEMTERILRYLTELAKGEKCPVREVLEDYFQEKGTKINLRLQAKEVMGLVLHEYGRFSITTIDSFVQRVVKQFLIELGASAGHEVSFEQDEVLQASISELLDKLEPNSELEQWLIDYQELKASQSKAGFIENDLWDLGKEIFKERYQLLRKESNWEALDFKGFSELQAHFSRELGIFLEELRAKAADICEEFETLGLTPDDFSYKHKSGAGKFKQLSLGIDKVEDAISSRAASLVDPEKWFSKSAIKNDKRLEATKLKLQDLGWQHAVQDYVDFYSEHAQLMTSYEILLQQFHYLGLLGSLDKEAVAYKKSEGMMLGSDMLFLLHGMVQDLEAPFIYERMGNYYDHFLLDEFQDTSRMQWESIRPLLVNGISQNHMSLAVGDGKQAIYRWRGGEVELIQDLEKGQDPEIKPFLRTEQLRVNYRSEPTIVRFNNTLFRLLLNGILEEAVSPHLGVPTIAPDKTHLADLQQLYQTYRQNLPPHKKEGTEGYVSITQISEGGEEEQEEKKGFKQKSLELLLEELKKLRHKDNCQTSIGILVRGNAEAYQVSTYLFQQSQLPENQDYILSSTSKESLALGSSPSVQFIVAAINYAAYPTNRLAINRLQLAYLNLFSNEEAIEEAKKSHDYKDLQAWKSDIFQMMQGGFWASASYLAQRSLFEYVEMIIKDLGLLKRELELPYLRTFSNEVLDFSLKHNEGLKGFLGWWIEKGQNKTVYLTGVNTDIQIMTIHSSKGLEFDHVFIPFCTMPFERGKSQGDYIIWARASDETLGSIGRFPVGYSKKLHDSQFCDDFLQEQKYLFVDNLNLLYVAVTRAVKSLFIHVPEIVSGRKLRISPSHSHSKEHLKNYGELLAALCDRGLEINEEQKEHFIAWPKQGEGTTDIGFLSLKNLPKEDTSANILPIHPISSNWRDSIVISRIGKAYFHPIREEDKQTGVAFHKAMALVNSKEDLDECLRYLKNNLKEEDYNRFEPNIVELIRNSPISVAFESGVNAWNEKDLCYHGEVIRPDRVCFLADTCMVLDYKTGSFNDQHRKQMKHYMQALRELGNSEVEGYMCYFSEDLRIEKLG